MIEIKKFDVSVGSGIIKIFQRLDYKLEKVFSEFIDNSLQSFLDHSKELKICNVEKCKVSIEWKDDQISISDNAYGMNEEEFGRALKLKSINPNFNKSNQLGIYGMGLKYACAFLGDKYSISSTAYNSNIKYFAEIDIDKFELNNPDTLDVPLNPEPYDTHETIITIKNLKIKQSLNKLENLREKLGLIYQYFINKGVLSISLNNIPVTYQKPQLRKNETGGTYYEDFSDFFEIDKKKYHFSGWIGILDKGNQSITGFNLIQANRSIELNYRPEKLFGKGNSFQNSRIIGQIVFEGDNFILSFNKDKFVWTDNGAEEAFINKLKDNESIKYIISQSKKLRKNDGTKQAIKKTNKILEKTNISFLNKNVLNEINYKTNTINVLKDKNNIFNTYEIEVNGKKIILYVKTNEVENNQEWIKLLKEEEKYTILLNNNISFFEKCTQETIAAYNSIGIILVISMLKAESSGLKFNDSTQLLNLINSELKKNNE